jgi:hypothetical protein
LCRDNVGLEKADPLCRTAPIPESLSTISIMSARLMLVAVLALFLNSPQPKKPLQQSAPADQRGTQESPLVVKVEPTVKTPEEAAQETQDRNQKLANDGNAVKLTGILAAIAFLQLLVYGYQAAKLRATVKSAGEQAEAMERHIGEAARSEFLTMVPTLTCTRPLDTWRTPPLRTTPICGTK